MKKNSFSFSIILFITIVFIYSCSTEEDNNSLPSAPASLKGTRELKFDYSGWPYIVSEAEFDFTEQLS